MRTRVIISVILVLALFAAFSVNAAADAGTRYPTLVNKTPEHGSLAGNRAGSFWYAWIDYQGRGEVVTLNLKFAPADPVTSLGVGFNVYGPTGGYLVGSGKPTLRNDIGIRTLQFASDKPQRLLLQVFNYIGGSLVHFDVTAEGLASAPAPVVPVLSGSLTGSQGGAFARYTLTFQKAGEAELLMNFSPSDAVVSRGVNFRVYGPQGLVAMGASTGVEGEVRAVFTPAVGTRYLLQVENYIPGASVSYRFKSGAALTAAAGG